MTADSRSLPIAIPDGGPGTGYPSIFNDVIGPVMRGPSSSHCAAAVRIGRMARDLMGGALTEVLVEFHPGGSLATTHESQGSDMGLFGGLLGWEATDPRLVDSAEAIAAEGISVEIGITDFPAFHPNTYRLTLRNDVTEHRLTALSTGGGMIRVVEVDGLPALMQGDYHETLLFLASPGDDKAAEEGLRARLAELEPEEVVSHHGQDLRILQVKSMEPLPDSALAALKGDPRVREVCAVGPALPVQSRKNLTVPFSTTEELVAYNETRSLELWELAVEYESIRGGGTRSEVVERMGALVRIMEGSIREGLEGTQYTDRILGPQAGAFREALESGSLVDAGALNRMILYTTAVMETKSAMGVVVAAPTAGSCGAVPGTLIGAGHGIGATHDDLTHAMLAAGLVGLLITARSTFAAEVCGCQAECGAGSGMAAAGLVTLAGGTLQQALGAASMALQNTLGMICDPVANRVEVPCLGRNVLAAGNALACANMALAGFDPVIPLDEVIETMDRVGKSLPHELRCTALGGLSVTNTSRRIEERLRNGR